jgi:hypothetical protein
VIVRGQVKWRFVERHEITRTKHDDPTTGQVAMWEEFPDGLNWIMCDFDKIASVVP